jgi:hypothetical protein
VRSESRHAEDSFPERKVNDVKIRKKALYDVSIQSGDASAAAAFVRK